jgi:hypothetical protein
VGEEIIIINNCQLYFIEIFPGLNDWHFNQSEVDAMKLELELFGDQQISRCRCLLRELKGFQLKNKEDGYLFRTNIHFTFSARDFIYFLMSLQMHQ